MRDLLFRAKRTDNGEWVEGSYVHLYLNRHYIFTGKLDLTQHNYKGRIGFECFEVNPETVGQYTGVNDFNGAKIFEGDIVQFSLIECHGCHGIKQFGCVEFYAGEFYMVFASGEETFMSSLSDDDYIYEIVGNIYDNPGTLKTKENG